MVLIAALFVMTAIRKLRGGKMNNKEIIKKTISEIENNITEIKRELEDPGCYNKAGKLQSIEYAEEMILDFRKVLEKIENGK